MAHCVNCSSFVTSDTEQHYFVRDMGFEIVSRIEQNLGNEILDGGELCENCLLHLTETLSAENDSIHSSEQSGHNSSDEVHGPLPYETNVCVRCRSSLFRRRSRAIGPESMRNVIAEMIHPRQIPSGGLLCFACWVYARRIVQENVREHETDDENSLGGAAADTPFANECVWCTMSLSRRRRHNLPEGPIRDEIAARILPRQIPENGLVCYACWVSARRNVQRQIEEIPDRPGPSFRRHHLDRCAWCQTSLHRRRTHSLPEGDERIHIIESIHPRELPENPLVCIECWSRAQRVVQQDLTFHAFPNITENTEMVTLNGFRLSTRSSSHCFVPGCRNTERFCVPQYLRQNILRTKKIFVTRNARTCEDHKRTYNWDILDETDFSTTFTKSEIEEMLSVSLEEQIMFVNFEKIDDMEESVLWYFAGVTKPRFYNILQSIPMLQNSCKTSKTALGAYLMKNRTGDSHERLASLLKISPAKVCRLLQCARNALVEEFVPLHLGVNHITRDDLILKNLLIPEGLFGDRQERKVIVIVDGTYVYLQKSSNYLFQKKSYSLHKYRNLVKPFLIVATDGHILDISGPYPATTSDADIMKSLFQDPNSELRRFFQEDDIMILDRGFRDAVTFLEDIGYKIYKPESLEEGETQLSTEKANRSRCVTLCRWVVEVVNGRFKRDYKIFRQEFFNLAATHLMDDFRICGALINAFHQEIVDRPDAQLILNRALARLHVPNVLADYVIQNNINRRRAQFQRIDESNQALDVFPQMDHSDLVLFALGIYQIKQAYSYYGEHKRQNGSFVVEMCNEVEMENMGSSNIIILRGRIRSRHIGHRLYYTYIALSPQGTSWEEKFVGYYCSCVCGKRTVGCCAHIMTIVWYLAWARHQESVAPPATFLDGILVRDDVENEEF